MVFQGYPTQAEALSEGWTHPLGPTFGNSKRVGFRVIIAQCLGVVVVVMMDDGQRIEW